MLNGVQNGILIYVHPVERRDFREKELDRGMLATPTLETQLLEVNRNIVTLKECEEMETHFKVQR